MIVTLPRFIFDFEQPRARTAALLLLLTFAVISGNIGMPGSLPAVRLEQILLLLFIPSMVRFHRSHPEFLRPRLLDYAFLALAGTTIISIVAAPLLVSEVTWSLRDPFEVARVVQYWLLFRLALTVVPSGQTMLGVIQLLLVIVIASTAFSVLQYLHPADFNEKVTALWTIPHNLRGVENYGRVVGTVGNANYYAIFSSLFLALALALILLRAKLTRAWRWIAVLAVFAGSLSMVMSQSRTASLATLGSFAITFVLVAAHRRGAGAYASAIGVFLAVTLVSIAFVELVPPRNNRVSDRFNPLNLVTDSSVTGRISRWQSFFSATSDGTPPVCNAPRLDQAQPAPAHLPTGFTGSAPAGAQALARDTARKDDIAALARGIGQYYCAEKQWPAEEGIEKSLVPRFLARWPLDPQTGEPYLLYVRPQGFIVGARLENPADPDGPIYALGTFPNVVGNPSFETDRLSGWILTYGAKAETTSSSRLFGEQSAAVTFTAPEGGPLGGFIHRVIFEFPLGTDYTVATWARNLSDRPQELMVYLSGRTADGRLLEGMARRTFHLSATDEWVRLEFPFTTPPSTRISELHISLYSPSADGLSTIHFDGLTLNQGNFAPHFALIRDIAPSSLKPVDLPAFKDSPIIGTGPGNSLPVRRVLDNEYLLFLDRYGVLGTTAYIALFAVSFFVTLRLSRRTHDVVTSALALAIMTFTIALSVFNVAAGSFHHFQIMAVYWLLIGLLTAAGEAERRTSATESTQQGRIPHNPQHGSSEPEAPQPQPAGLLYARRYAASCLRQFLPGRGATACTK